MGLIDNWHRYGRKVATDEFNIIGGTVNGTEDMATISIALRSPTIRKIRSVHMNPAEAELMRDLIVKQLAKLGR